MISARGGVRLYEPRESGAAAEAASAGWTVRGASSARADARRHGKGLNGFDCVSRSKGSVPVQAGDHRKRRCNQLSANSKQSADSFALAA